MATAAQVNALAAGASGGSAGAAAYQEAQQQVTQGRDATLTNLRQMATDIGAPEAFTMQMATELSAPAATALSNLAQEGAAASAAGSQIASGTSTYRDEANQALPLIRAEADRDLGQKLAMLNASHAGDQIDASGRLAVARIAMAADAAARRSSGGGGGGRSSGGGGGGGGDLSDSELRVRIAGLTQQYRNELAQMSQQKEAAKVWKGSAIIQPAPGGINPVTMLATMNTAGATPQAQQRQATLIDALSRIKNAAYGPGFTRDAQTIGARLGIDPYVVGGLFGPSYESSYLRNSKGLGLYNDPNERNLTGQTLTVAQAGRALGFDPQRTAQLAGKMIWAWSDKKGPASSALGEWLKNTKGFTDDTLNAMGEKDLQKYQAEFIRTVDRGGQFAQTASDLVLPNAHAAIIAGLDYETWRNKMMNKPEAKRDPDSFLLAIAQAAPLFAYAAAQHTRSASLDTSAPDFTGGEIATADSYGG